MSITEEFNRASLIERAKNLLLQPVETWTVIASEPATAKSLYMGYAVVLAAIPPVAGLIGSQLFGYGALGVTYHPALIGSTVGAILRYALSLVMIYVFALIIDALAPSFGGQKNHIQALKVAVYSYTAAWVAGIFSIIPALGILGVLGALYSLYLLYLGLPRLMNAPQTRALGYTVVCVIVGIVLSMVVGAVVGALGLGAISTTGAGSFSTHASDGSSDTLRIGNTTIDLGKLKAASQQMEAAAKQAKVAGKNETDSADEPTVTAVPAAMLQSYLPASVAGYARGDFSATSGGVAGITGSSAQAEYAKEGAHMTLTLTDLGGAGGFAALAGVLSIESSKQTANGYEKVGKVDGRMTNEKWDGQSKNGIYGVLVANRFMVQAEGNGGTMDDLKQAVGAIAPDRLESLAKQN